MIPVNFPNPPTGCTHKVISKHDRGLLYFYAETKKRLYDTETGEWLSAYWTLDNLSNYLQFTTEPLTVELENK